MIAKLPTLPPTASPRAAQAHTSAEARQQLQQQTTFERTLTQRQRAQRHQDDARDTPAPTKPAKSDKPSADQASDARPVTKKDQKTTEIQVESETTAVDEPVETTSSVDGETVEAAVVETDDAVIEGQVLEEEPVVVEETSEQTQMAVAQVAGQLLEQVTQAITAPMESASAVSVAVAQDPAQSGSAVTSPVVKKTESDSAASSLAPTLDVAVDAGEQEQARAATPLTSPTAVEADDAAITAASNAGAIALPESEAVERQGGKTVSAPIETSALPAVTSSAPSPEVRQGGEVQFAQMAQLPRGDESMTNDEVNMGRLTRGLASAVNQRGGSVTLRLTPPELGLVRIDMAVREGVVNAKFTAQSESVRNLLMDQMGQLRQALDRQGLSVDKIDVQVTPQAPSGGFDRQMDDMSRDGRSAGRFDDDGRRQGGSSQRQGRQPDADSFERMMAQAAG